ncbi:MAG: DUF3135 domain-containing protein [Marinospirillum sp.]|uniref:DUF3135 domain-containing protein n=1 Tax=Marinospirillum sp. TaxID=2183934 RepID=UPI0019E8558C|nr:DUF3135 domain-containing protein [Marinospirillum sp.]MBE0507387.1 DUF3135 domain-containing protein [Marinospirillum sp.]
MPVRNLELPPFDEMVRLHQQGLLDNLLEEKNQEFMAAVPEDSRRRPELERLQFQLCGLRARHQGMGRIIALSRLMHESLAQMIKLLHFSDFKAIDNKTNAPRLLLVHKKMD